MKLKPEDVRVTSLGPCVVPSPLSLSTRFGDGVVNFVPEDARLRHSVAVSSSFPDEGDVFFELAGPRAKLFFAPADTIAAVVTCGGLCPGLNNVIRSIFQQLHYAYGVPAVYGIRYGYRGLHPDSGAEPVFLTEALVERIHRQGGTVLGSSRGPGDIGVMVEFLRERGINVLFCLGGDGTQRGAHKIAEEALRRELPIAVMGVPKTIDNDIPFVERTFGFATAVEQARRVLDGAHVEAKGADNGIALVKLMGRHAGFIAAAATEASQDVNVCLVPEVPFTLEGEGGLLPALKERILDRHHAVVVVAEGAGQDLVEDGPEGRDASGNVKLDDIGLYLRDRIKAYFAAEGVPAGLKYFDPSYTIRSVPADAVDAVLCDRFARYAVDAAGRACSHRPARAVWGCVRGIAMLSKKRYMAKVDATRARRMKWWNEARFGMFIHWGLYAQMGRNEWVMNIECIPVKEYEKLADSWKPKPRPMREWARLAKKAGMNYMVMTTKHHEGYCLWDTAMTDYNSVARGPGRDLVQEFVDACREYDLKIGFYYSLMDWHHPDGMRCAKNAKARRRFLDFTQGCVRELMSNYGKIDVLWYDVSYPLRSPEAWESLKMNQVVRELQPHIIVNNRSQLDEDFSTPEGSVNPAAEGRGWEACMTFNHASWGYMPAAAHDAHNARDVLGMLNIAAGNQGNLLLNIGPAPDGSVPKWAVQPLTTVGRWLGKNGEAVYGKVNRVGPNRSSACCSYSRKGNVLYAWVKHWPGESELPLGGFRTKLKKASFLASGKRIRFTQSKWRIVLKGLPKASPDKTAGTTVLKLEFESKPVNVPGATTMMI
jgi:6-phosphofructokinase